MLRYFIIVILIYAFVSSVAQNIDSLKKALPVLRDSSRIDCLNEIVFYYLAAQKKDSIEYYLTPAYEESKKINYIHGIALSLSQRAGIIEDYANNKQVQKMVAESLQWYQLTDNKKYVEYPFYQMGREFFGQSKWDEAITNLNQCFYWAKKAGAYDNMLLAISLIGEVYRESSRYDSAFEVFKKELQMARQFKDTLRIEGALCNIGDLYQAIEDYPTALVYYNQGFKIARPQDLTVFDYIGHAELCSLTHQYDSALYYYNFIDSAKTNIQMLPYFLISKGEYFLLLRQYETALDYFLKGLLLYRQLNSVNQIKRALLDVAKVYSEKSDNTNALLYAREGLNIALQTKSRQYIRDAYQILYAVYDRLQKTDSAYIYYKKYIAMKETVLSDQVKGKFAAYTYEQKIDLLNKKEQLQQQQIKQSTLEKWFLISGIAIIILSGLIIFRNILLKRKNEKLENEKKQSELQGKASELEMQALRSQMNPHFIFNCLNSINRFIINSDGSKAADYLTKFAKLIRIVLEQSGKSFVPLEDELKCLQLYMDLEALRFEIPFKYEIDYKEIDISSVLIPTLLIQPFVENAIWHGLQGAAHIHGKITIHMRLQDNILHCKICDNGIGRTASAKGERGEAGKTSLGINITQHRLQLIDSSKQQGSGIEIQDLINEEGHSNGTCVEIKIPVKEM